LSYCDTGVSANDTLASAVEERVEGLSEMSQESDSKAVPVRLPGVRGVAFPAYPHETPFSVITMGTGSPELNPRRASACTVVQYRGNYYVLDTGNGASLSFVKGGLHGSYRHRDIAAVIFTHLHQDHVNDYFDLVTTRWGEGGKHLALIGPPGVAELHRFLVTFFRDDLVYRWLIGAPGGVDEEGMFKGVEVREITGANEFDLDGMRVKTAEMTHSIYDMAYRFDVEGKSVVVSGDTSFDPRLTELAKGADVLVIDANPWADGTAKPPPRRSLAELPAEYQVLTPYRGIPDAPNHMPMRDVVRIAAEAGVGTVVLTHLWPLPVDQELIDRTGAAFVAGGFEGRVVFAEDGLEVAV
jgi:ribonuclease BN (tRNA processing enzyme)